MAEKFARTKHAFLYVRDLSPHPTIQRRFDPARAKHYKDTFDPDKFGEIAVVLEEQRHLVFDGQHRLWAAREVLGEDQRVPCVIYSGLSTERQAELFLGRNDAKPVRATDKFKIAVLANQPNETAIANILTGMNLRVDDGYIVGVVRSPAALLKVYGRYGEITLRRALRVIEAAWGRNPDAYDGLIIRAVGKLLHQFGADIEDAELSRKLERHGTPGRMVGAARDHAKMMGTAVERAALERLINIYNKGRRSKMIGQPSHDQLAA